MATHDESTAQQKFPDRRNHSERKHTGWIDHLMITSASRNKDLAEQFLELHDPGEDAKSGLRCHRLHAGEWNSRRVMTAEQRKALHLDDVENYQKHIYFWQNVPRRAK